MADSSIEVPDIGDVEEVDVVEVLVRPGMRVEVEQGLVVLESDKASMEIPSPRAGVVKEVKVAVGDRVAQGTLLAVLDLDEDTEQATAAALPSEPTKPAAAAPEPEPTARDEEPERLRARRRASQMARTMPPPRIPMPDSPPASNVSKPHATPSVRRLARQLGVDLSHVGGTGRSGRITKDDVQRYVKHAMSVAGTATGGGFAVPALPDIDFSQFGEVAREPLTKIQRISGQNLHRSWVTIPHVTQFDEADITELEEFRRKMRAERPDTKLTLTAFFMKAVVVMLKAMPRFNSSLEAGGQALILKRYFHVGVAVDTPRGLVVPVIRDVDIKGLHDLAEELADVSARARTRKLSPSDLQGASMTISSLGGIGGTHFTPIINPPEVAVLGISRAVLRPAWNGQSFVPRLMCGLSLSYDHRVIDGADAVRFTTRLREVLGDIRQMLL
ncbi:MAG: dihydrolipoyllysine-residue acetyltransferase [Myxococcales bacterium]|nr:dihydrolipoyllysine-residue acetyltransferase [Myxococcales bacterium]